MKSLLENGITCHFTMGGHFPSLSYQETFEFIPEIDSVVRFEGEDTLLELVDLVAAKREWRTVQGIAFRRNGATINNPPRRLIEHLDKLPYPDHQFHPGTYLTHSIIPILPRPRSTPTRTSPSIH